jgi:protein-tyrosine-phosphatase
MAEALMRRMLAEGEPLKSAGLDGVEVASAGVFAGAGQPASAEAVAVASELGADLSTHRSLPLTREGVAQADLIYTMTEQHRLAVLAMAPEAKGKTQRLDATGDISDPYGGDTEVYRQTAEQIRRALVSRIKDIGR